MIEIIGEITPSAQITGTIQPEANIIATVLTGHTHTNKSILDETTASFTIEDKQSIISAITTYIYEQVISSDSWLITHNLKKYPSVTVVDSAGSVVSGDIQYLSINSLVLTFSGEFSGKAYLN